MRVKFIVDEDFVNYKKASMFIGTISCGGKCCIEAHLPLSMCQNDGWRAENAIEVSDDELIQRYLRNDLTSAIVFGGLEPFEQFEEMLEFINTLRYTYNCNDDVVIYTGYTEKEISQELLALRDIPNIIVKVGRFIPNSASRYDEILGVTLISDNQYAICLSEFDKKE